MSFFSLVKVMFQLMTMSNDSRRLLFMVSLHIALCEHEHQCAEDIGLSELDRLRQINIQSLHGPQSLDTPKLVADHYWSDVISKSSKTSLIKEVLEHTPSWLKYDLELMKKDMSLILTEVYTYNRVGAPVFMK